MPDLDAMHAPSLAERIGHRKVTLLGCGKMGGALLAGWRAAGMDDSRIQILEPYPSPELSDLVAATDMVLNPESLNAADAVAVIAVKPQSMESALPRLAPLENGLFVSIAAGTSLATLSSLLPPGRLIRAMPNTPAAIGRGITALVAGEGATGEDIDIATALLGAAGETVWLGEEAHIDIVTAVSGSGPAYVFHMIECMADAGVAEGLDPDHAQRLALAAVAGAAELARLSTKSPTQLRKDVTSPGGTTEAALQHLLDTDSGLSPLMRRCVSAATRRGRELA